jgi:DNA replication protein
MGKFPGFSDSETFTRLPETFFHRLLNEIDDLAELKVTLYAIWRIEHTEGSLRALRQMDFVDQPQLSDLDADEIASGLEKAVSRGTLIRVAKKPDVFYFLNSPRGRAAADALRKDKQHAPAKAASTPPVERPNIFKLYEENIGPLTPIIAETLRDAEQEYPPEWIEEAIGLAVTNNKRNWRYAEAILKRWKEEGHGQKQDRRDAEKDRRRYVEGDFADFIEH